MNWFIAHLTERDADALHEELGRDAEERSKRGLPTFEPSYEVAYKIGKWIYEREKR